MATQPLSPPNDGSGSAGNTAGACGDETQPDESNCCATTAVFTAAAASSGVLSSLQISLSSTELDSTNDEGN